MDAYYGEIRLFAGSYAPADWAFCNGQTLQIQQYTVLYSVLGITYGGDGKSTFALPNLQAIVPLQQGTGIGLTPWLIGEQRGDEEIMLDSTNLPSHTHNIVATAAAGNSNSPTGTIFGARGKNDFDFVNSSPDSEMDQTIVGVTGANSPLNIMQPYLVLNYIISLYGPNYPVKSS